MPQFSMRVEGLDKVRVGFNKFVTTLPVITKAVIKKMMLAAMKQSVPFNGGNSYGVPERGYIRTGQLGRVTRLDENGLTYTIKSDAYTRQGKPYSRLVIGDAQGQGQARVHEGWWVPMRTAVDYQLENALPEADRELQKGAEAAGL